MEGQDRLEGDIQCERSSKNEGSRIRREKKGEYRRNLHDLGSLWNLALKKEEDY